MLVWEVAEKAMVGMMISCYNQNSTVFVRLMNVDISSNGTLFNIRIMTWGIHLSRSSALGRRLLIMY